MKPLSDIPPEFLMLYLSSLCHQACVGARAKMPALPSFIFISFFASGKQCQGVAEVSVWLVVSGLCLMMKPTGMSWCHSVPQGKVLILLWQKSVQKHFKRSPYEVQKSGRFLCLQSFRQIK